MPPRGQIAFRHYLVELVEHNKFIKRAQFLGLLRRLAASRRNLHRVIKPRRSSQRKLSRTAIQIRQTEMHGLFKISLCDVLPLIVEHVSFYFLAVFPTLAGSPYYREFMIGIGASIKHRDNQLVITRIVMNVGKIIRQRHCRYQFE